MPWLDLHPKVKALAYAVGALVLASVPGVLTNVVSLHDAAIADAVAVIGLLIPYLTPANPA